MRHSTVFEGIIRGACGSSFVRDDIVRRTPEKRHLAACLKKTKEVNCN
jgi:hypothetical protein